MTNKAVFLDRDGVITEDPPHYAHRLDQLKLIEKSASAIKLLNTHGFYVIVISNQSGVARGYYREEDITIFNNEMIHLLENAGAHIDEIYYCPHHPEAAIEYYKKDCMCRKPKPGMILEGIQKFSLEVKNSYIVGDKWSDIQAGKSAGLRTILVLTGHGTNEISQYKGSPNYVAKDLFDGVTNYILKQ